MDVAGIGPGVNVPNIATFTGNVIDGSTVGSVTTPTFTNDLNVVSLNLTNNYNACFGDTVTLEASGTDTNYVWQDNSTDSTFMVTQTGTYWVSIMVNCDTITDSVTINFQLPVDLGNDTTLCVGDSIALGALGVAGNYTWQDGSMDSTFTVLQAGTYFVNINSGDCPSRRDTITISYSASPVVNLGNDTTLCQGNNLGLDVTGPIGAYLWQDNSTNSTYQVTQAGVYWVDVLSSCGTITDTINVYYDSIVALNLGNDTNLCAGNNLLLDVSGISGNYVWQDNSTNSNFNVSLFGTYWVDIISACPTISDTINVTYDPNQTINLGNDTIVCDGDNFTLSLMPQAIGTYLWQDGSTNPIFTGSLAGTYWLDIISACPTISDTINVTYFNGGFIDLGVDTVLCGGNNLVLDASGGNGTYLWQDNSTNSTFTVTQAGTYFVAVNSICPTVYDTLNISFNEIMASFSPTIPETCNAVLVSFENLSTINTGNIQTWTWDFGNDMTSSLESPSSNYTQSGNYNVALTVASNGCIDDTTITVLVDVFQSPVAAFSMSETLTKKNEPIQFQNLSTGEDTWEWHFGNGASSTFENPSYSYLKPGLYAVELIASNANCSDTAFASLQIEDELLFYIPNAFTPTSSRFNEVFKPIFTSGFDPYEYQLTIFNRQGEILFVSNNSEIGWDGKYDNNRLVPQGVYIWNIEYGTTNNDDVRVTERGHVTLLK